MSRAVLLCAALCVFCGTAAALAPLLGDENSKDLRADMYIVVFNETATETDRTKHIAGQAVEKTFDIEAFHGYSAKLDDAQLQAVRAADIVAYVHRTLMFHMDTPSAPSCAKQPDAVWGLDRITEEEVPSTGLKQDYYFSSSAGEGVDAYIIDTGIRVTHHEFSNGRAHWGTNTVDNVNEDCQGHGTHVAGTVAGGTYGVAKLAHVYAVKVLDCEGYGSDAAVIKGIEWAVTNHKSQETRPGLINMSLGGGLSQALNDAVTAAVSANLPAAVSAGNSNADACTQSPASTPAAITVGATELVEPNLDRRSGFSNYGDCVSIFGPGTGIMSAWNTTDSATKVISGTSMASPHIAGGIALFLGKNPTARPAEVLEAMRMKATDDQISMQCDAASSKTSCEASINALLYTKWLCDE